MSIFALRILMLSSRYHASSQRLDTPPKRKSKQDSQSPLFRLRGFWRRSSGVCGVRAVSAFSMLNNTEEVCAGFGKA